MQLGRLGVWSWMDMFSAADAAAFAARVEGWGYSALWSPEAVGRDPLALHAHLAGATSELILATGIANIYARDPMTMRAGRDTLAELSGGRFLDFFALLLTCHTQHPINSKVLTFTGFPKIRCSLRTLS